MDKSQKIYSILERTYPGARTALIHADPFQLLVATILSAQCTDERVNKVTPPLFEKYGSPAEFAEAELKELESDIRSTGFYKNKAKNIKASAGIISSRYKGRVPSEMEDLIALPGVARKTANIVLFHAYGKNEGVAVDTHVRRLSGRMGFTGNTDPVKIEKDLMEMFPREKWGEITNVLIAHGRAVCKARNPECGGCPVGKICPKKGVKG
ncbi:MAG: endonuclease III [Candidatus Omnitrophica bacterium]|nr:endonuclease III [Candidatus Omnitrophota bacterium]